MSLPEGFELIDVNAYPAFHPEALAAVPKENTIQETLRNAVGISIERQFVKALPAGTKYHDGVSGSPDGYKNTTEDGQGILYFLRVCDAEGKISNPFGMLECPWGTYVCIYSMNGSYDSLNEVVKAKGYTEATLSNLL